MGFNRILTGAGLTDEQAREAALFLAGRARDAEDARLLLEACGLVPYESGEPPKVKAKAEHSATVKYPRPGQ